MVGIGVLNFDCLARGSTKIERQAITKDRILCAWGTTGTGKVGDVWCGCRKSRLLDCCAWQILGEGQYKPAEGSNPFKGEQGNLEILSEYKVEMVCAEEFVEEVVRVMKGSHPYEEVAYSVIRIEVFE